LSLLDGWRLKWAKKNCPIDCTVPEYESTSYSALGRDDHLNRAYYDNLLNHWKGKGQMVNVRSPDEFSGEWLHIPGFPNKEALCGGYIP